MGIREALKSLRGGDKNDGHQNKGDADIAEGEAPEPTWFVPRYDGTYVAAAAPAAPAGAAGPGSDIGLRFLPSGKVFESSGGSHRPGPEQQNPCRGEYTAAGRFNVQRQFERIISYAVLEMEPEGFFARRINGADRSTAELHFRFRPDEADTG